MGNTIEGRSAVVIRIFVCSAGLLLLITAVAKLVSAAGTAKILQTQDPILGIPFRFLFWIAGTIELAVACRCFFARAIAPNVALVAWLATAFGLYRLGMVWMGDKYCSCLGNLTDALGVRPDTVNTVMKCILLYLLVGSYTSLFWVWKQNPHVNGSDPVGPDVVATECKTR